MIRRVIEIDGERLLPYLTVRRGQAQEIAIAAVREHLAAGRRDGSIRDLDEQAAGRLFELVVLSLVTASAELIDDSLTPAIDAELGLMLDAWLRPEKRA